MGLFELKTPTLLKYEQWNTRQLLKDRTRSKSVVNDYKFSNLNQLQNIANDLLWYNPDNKINGNKYMLIRDLFKLIRSWRYTRIILYLQSKGIESKERWQNHEKWFILQYPNTELLKTYPKLVVNIPGLLITILCINKWILKKSQIRQDEESDKSNRMWYCESFTKGTQK